MRFGIVAFTVTLIELFNNGVIAQNEFEIITCDEGVELCNTSNEDVNFTNYTEDPNTGTVEQEGKFRNYDGEIDHLQGLQDWVLESGGEINKIKMYEFEPGNNGIISSEDIKKDELIIFIPHDVLITKQVAEQSLIVKYLYQNGLLDPAETLHDRLLL